MSRCDIRMVASSAKDMKSTRDESPSSLILASTRVASSLTNHFQSSGEEIPPWGNPV